jgi:hypothetical protein
MSPMPSVVACRDCQFWDEQQVLQKTPQGASRIGLCLRFPPQVVIVPSPQGILPMAMFPSTQALQACGEFQAKSLIET